MAPDALEIHGIHPLLRAYTVLVWACFGTFMIGLALRFPSTGHTFGYLLGGSCLWAALYWWRVPDVRVTLRPGGMDYVDTSLGALMRFPVRHAAWSDVVAVETRPVVSRYGSYLATRVTVRDSRNPKRTRLFAVTSRHDGYTRLLDALAAHTAEGTMEMRGPGVRSARVHHEMWQIMGGQFKLIAGFLLAAGALLVAMNFVRH